MQKQVLNCNLWLNIYFWSVTGFADGYSVVCGSHTASSTENKQIIKEQNQNEGTECLDTSSSQKKEIITWVHLIRYHSYIKGLCHTKLFGMIFFFLLENCFRWHNVFMGLKYQILSPKSEKVSFLFPLNCIRVKSLHWSHDLYQCTSVVGKGIIAFFNSYSQTLRIPWKESFKT